jgi:VanZ family protein
MIRAKIPGLICACVLLGILAAGLAPFGRPRNAVTWLGNQNGVQLGRHATMWSSGSFPAAEAGIAPACSLEIWLQPENINAANTFLAFYTPENPLQLQLQQYHGLLILSRQTGEEEGNARVIGAEGVFRRIEPLFITITSGSEKSAMYVDGGLARSFPGTSIGRECAGQLVIGTSAMGQSTWRGEIKGLALYKQELTAEEVLRHYQTWTTQGRPEVSPSERAIAIYLFDERAGNTVHNEVHPGIELYIPPRFALLHQQFLEPFWEEFKPGPSYWKDIAVNIVGFIPLGFFFCAYWSSVRPIKHPALTTVLLGLAVSLTIEVLQSYLPTRDSGTTDLITNTFGTFLGVRLYGWQTARRLLARFYFEKLQN